jgi:hypothetical protein
MVGIGVGAAAVVGGGIAVAAGGGGGDDSSPTPPPPPDPIPGTYHILLTMTDEPAAECWTYPPNGGIFGQGTWTVNRSGDRITIQTSWNAWPDITGTLDNSQMVFTITSDEYDGRQDPSNPCYVISTMRGTLKFFDERIESNNIISDHLYTRCAEHCDGRTYTRTMRLDGTKQ